MPGRRGKGKGRRGFGGSRGPGRRMGGAMRGNVSSDYRTIVKQRLAQATKGYAFTNRRGQMRIPIIYNGQVIGVLREDVPDLNALEPLNITTHGRGNKVRLGFNGRVVGRMRLRWIFVLKDQNQTHAEARAGVRG